MIEIWHNPRCSKSRQAFAILEAKGVAHQVRLYFEGRAERGGIAHSLKGTWQDGRTGGASW